MRSISGATCFVFILLVVGTLESEGRSLGFSSSELVSDGTDDGQTQNSNLFLKSSESSGKYCEQMYGFLPCSSNILGHLFLILVYEYLLFHGESYLAAGGEQVFNILGPGIFGASVFDILGALPESLILLVTGLSSDKERAQEYASTGVGLLAGSSILHLTIVWGTCVIVGRQKLSNSLFSSGNIKESLTGFGITMDEETGKMAMFMVCSVVPLLIMQISTLFQFSYTPHTVTLIIASIVAVIFLILYFIYQILKPMIETARLEYIKHGHLILRIFQHVEKKTLQSILSEDGTPNELAIYGLYNEINQNGSRDLLQSEIIELLHNKVPETNTNDEQIAEIIRIFDQNGDQIITKQEFVEGLKKYISQTRHAVDRKYLPKQSLKNMYQAFIKPWIEQTRKERELKRNFMSEVFKHVQNNMVDQLCKNDGTPDEFSIKKLFEKIDTSNDNKVSRSELEQLMKDIQVTNANEAVTKMFEELDLDKNDEISQTEFVDGFKKLLNRNSGQVPQSMSLPQGNHQTWEEVEKLVKGDQKKGVYAWLSALAYVVLGITMLSLLAEPLIESVQKFSEAAGISSFFISFILVPVATNFREATSAIREAQHKKERNTSQTIYEIYGAVFMNNILGFVVISILIYVRDISWEFSAEVLVVAIVCGVMGLTARFRTTFPLWTAIPAYLFYLLSLLLVVVLKYVLHYA